MVLEQRLRILENGLLEIEAQINSLYDSCPRKDITFKQFSDIINPLEAKATRIRDEIAMIENSMGNES